MELVDIVDENCGYLVKDSKEFEDAILQLIMDKNIYEAAIDLGCTKTQALFKVIIPQISSGIITGAIMAFTISIDDFVISYFTSGNVQTLPIAIYSMTRKVVSPEINALSTLLFLLVFALLLLVNLRRKREGVD